MRLVEGIADVEDLDEFLAALTDAGDEHGCTVQAFDARYVVDGDHLRRAVELADRAIERGENVARDRAVEILCYAAGRRQIDRALEMGIDEGRTPAVVLIVAEPAASADGEASAAHDGSAAEDAAADAVASLLEPAETLGAYDPDRVREFFDVSDAELAATAGDLADVVRERVALLDVEK